jgi:hypothetical protein
MAVTAGDNMIAMTVADKVDDIPALTVVLVSPAARSARHRRREAE